MKIIITGSSGFVGLNLMSFLSQQRFELSPLRLRSENVASLTAADLEADAIIHSGGIAHDLKGVRAEEDYQRDNTWLSIQLIDKFLRSNASDLIFISSVKALADTATEVIDERYKASPTTAYGVSKYKVEQYINALTLPKGKRIFILQPTLMYGAGCKGNLASLHKFVSKKMPYPFGAFSNRRSMLNVKNLGFVIAELLKDRSIPGDRFLVADDEPQSTSGLIHEIATAMDMKPRMINIPRFVISALAKVGDVSFLPLNSSMLSKLVDDLIVDNSKIKKVLHIDSMPYAISSGIKDMIDSMPKNQ